MKKRSYLFLLFLVQIIGVSARSPVATEKETEAQQVRLWEGRLQAAVEMPPPDRIDYLWNGLRSMAGRINNTDQSPEVDSMYYKIQKMLLATPGHAQHFANKLEKSRSEGTLSRNSYWYLNETLVHLPSPETVKVLGHYLNDERDKPQSPPRHRGTIPYPGTHMRAFEALSKIGLRDLPVTDVRFDGEKPAPGEKWTEEQWLEAELKRVTPLYLKRLEALSSYRKWWEEVKVGQRTFSFKGQAVEYRFKPDGTWDIIPIANPPDDGRKPAAATTSERPANKPPSALQVAQETSRDAAWWWYAVIASVLLALGTWFWRKKRAA